MRPLRALHVITSIADEASGTAQSVPALCRALAGQGADVELHAGAGEVPEGSPFRFFRHGRWPHPARLAVSPRLAAALRQAAGGADILHAHGLWDLSNLYAGSAAASAGRTLVVSPRGMLSPAALRLSKWRKRLMWTLAQKATLRGAALLHATGEDEYRDIRAAGLTAPVAVIPNGLDVPELPPRADAAPGAPRRLLFLGRVSPVKGLDILLRAWKVVQAEAPDWELSVVGPDDRGHLAELRRLSAGLGAQRVRFEPAVYGADKTRLLREAELFVLPSRSENFGMAVAEALAHGLPAVVSRGAPWSGLEAEGCGWWVEPSPEALAGCLRKAVRESPAALAARGARGRSWMLRDFGWRDIGRRMLSAYEWTLAGGRAPEWVRTR